jgi:hypothetical protein
MTHSARSLLWYRFSCMALYLWPENATSQAVVSLLPFIPIAHMRRDIAQDAVIASLTLSRSTHVYHVPDQALLFT